MKEQALSQLNKAESILYGARYSNARGDELKAAAAIEDGLDALREGRKLVEKVDKIPSTEKIMAALVRLRGSMISLDELLTDCARRGQTTINVSDMVDQGKIISHRIKALSEELRPGNEYE